MKIGRNRLSLNQSIRLSKNLFFTGGRSGLAGGGAFGFNGNANLQVTKLLQGNGAFGFNGLSNSQPLAPGSGTFGFTGAGNATNQTFEAEYQAYLDKGTALGYTLPSEEQQDLQNTLTKTLKDNGILALLDCFYIWAQDGDSDMATLNLVDPNNFQVTKFNSPTFTTNQGFTGNGVSSYLNTNFNPTTASGNFSQNNASFGAWLFTAYSTADRIGGMLSGGSTRLLNRNLSAQRINTGSTLADLTGTGLKILNKTSSGNVSMFSNLTRTDTTPSDLTQDNDVLSFLLSQGSVYGDMELSFGIIGADISGANTILYNALNDYLNAI